VKELPMFRNLLVLTLGLLIVFTSDPALAVKNAKHLNDLSCAVNEIARFNGIEWKCSLDEDTDTLGDLSCNTNQIAKYDGNEWVCSDNVLAGQSCPAGEAVIGFDADVNIICATVPTLRRIDLFPAQDFFATFQPDDFDSLCRFDLCPNGESKLGLKTLTLTCEAGDTAKITTDNVSNESPFDGTGVIVDNEMFVNNINVCDLGDSLGIESPSGNFNCFTSTSSGVGIPVQQTFDGIGEIVLSVGNGIGDIIPLGASTLAVELKDFGDRAGNTNLILETTCN
jgi:hypothetical protein